VLLPLHRQCEFLFHPGNFARVVCGRKVEEMRYILVLRGCGCKHALLKKGEFFLLTPESKNCTRVLQLCSTTCAKDGSHGQRESNVEALC
jgi:hypothetical protein